MRFLPLSRKQHPPDDLLQDTLHARLDSHFVAACFQPNLWQVFQLTSETHYQLSSSNRTSPGSNDLGVYWQQTFYSGHTIILPRAAERDQG